MDVIWKFPLATADLQSIEMPVDAKVLTVQVQVGPCLWAQCDPEAPKTKRCFETFGTGHPMSPARREYVVTYQLRDSGLVFHVFERLETEGA